MHLRDFGAAFFGAFEPGRIVGGTAFDLCQDLLQPIETVGLQLDIDRMQWATKMGPVLDSEVIQRQINDRHLAGIDFFTSAPRPFIGTNVIGDIETIDTQNRIGLGQQHLLVGSFSFCTTEAGIEVLRMV